MVEKYVFFKIEFYKSNLHAGLFISFKPPSSILKPEIVKKCWTRFVLYLLYLYL